MDWNWNEMCGPRGLEPWNNKTKDLGICFQELFLDMPVLFLIATTSAYFVGYRREWVSRGKIQETAINIRCLIALCLAITPPIHLYILITTINDELYPITYMLNGVACMTWLIHFMYILALKHRLGLSPRGPISVIVWWSSAFMLTVLGLRSRVLDNVSYSFSIVKLILHICYGLTLLPSEGACSTTHYSPHLVGSQYSHYSEYSPLLPTHDEDILGTAMQSTSWISRILFYWVEPLFQKGSQKSLKIADDLFDLPSEYRSNYIGHKIDRALIGNVDNYQERVLEPFMTTGYGSVNENIPAPSHRRATIVVRPSKRHNVTLFRALHKCFGLQFYSIGIIKFVSDTASFGGPLLMNKLIAYIQSDSINLQIGLLCAVGLFTTTMVSALCNTHFNMQMSLLSLKMRAAIISTVLRKTMSVTSSELNKSFSVGEITNFMSTDTDRIVNLCPSFHAVWSIPLQMFVALFLLYSQVGISFLAGIIFSIILIPINKLIANKIGELSTKMMSHKDNRVSLICEMLKGIRTIKLHVWEDYFISKVNDERTNEIEYLKGRKYLDALCVLFWATTPIIMTVLTLTTYSLLGNKLDAATVFTSVALMNMLIAPLNAFPWVLNGLTEAWVSLKRIQKLLELNDLDTEEYYDRINKNNDEDNVLVMKNATFSWAQASTPKQPKSKAKNKGKSQKRFSYRTSFEESTIQPFALKNLNVEIKRGSLVGVVGKVGSGKTSFLHAIIAEMLKVDGEIQVSESFNGFGYVSQTPWLQRGTIKDNILFGRAYEDTKFRTIVDACGLTEDLLMLGRDAAIGQGGCTLSGGQRVRIALARSVYQDKQVYLLDDVLSAVDLKVANHIFRKCITGLLKHKTRILVTHSLQFLEQANKVILLDNGIITKQGPPSIVLDDIDEYIHSDSESIDETFTTAVNETVKTSDLSNTLMDDISNKSISSILEQELSANGTVSWWVVGMYLKSVGIFLSICILISLLLMQITQNVTFLWLSIWVSNENPKNSTNATSVKFETDINLIDKIFSNYTTGFYLTIYIMLAACNVVFTLIRAFLFAYGGVCAATKIHKCLLKAVTMAKMKFFEVTPIGRIVNRFSSDTYTVDDSLPFIFNILLAQLFGLFGAILVTVYGLPWICLILVPLMPIYHWLQHRYRITSRELKRIQSTALSPIYSHFNDTLEGKTTIHALNVSLRCTSHGEELVDLSQRASLASSAAAQWLALRLQFIGVGIVGGAALVAVAQKYFHVVDAGLVGLAITYALTVTSLLSGVMNAFPETEREMIAVERIGHYINTLVPEQTMSAIINDIPLYGWPTHGVVCFDNVIMKYRENLNPALNNVSFETHPAEKIGIVGRTGAGKSSIVAALLRLTEICSGDIIIDSINIKNLSLSALRSRIAVIPQEPFIISGTVRENVDPLREYTDSDIWNALEKCGISEFVRGRGGLDSSADNITRGIAQLLCLARALMHNAKIVCIDEATANIDQETDRQIQETIRCSFRKSTVITIAHRISTILDSDRVLVMSEGQIVEYDSPERLLKDVTSHFYQLVNSGNVD